MKVGIVSEWQMRICDLRDALQTESCKTLKCPKI